MKNPTRGQHPIARETLIAGDSGGRRFGDRFLLTVSVLGMNSEGDASRFA